MLVLVIHVTSNKQDVKCCNAYVSWRKSVKKKKIGSHNLSKNVKEKDPIDRKERKKKGAGCQPVGFLH